jgi:hypothetical protein
LEQKTTALTVVFCFCCSPYVFFGSTGISLRNVLVPLLPKPNTVFGQPERATFAVQGVQIKRLAALWTLDDTWWFCLKCVG